MWSIGFGLEIVGLWAKRFPVFFSGLLIAITLFAGYQATKVRFDGDVTAVLPAESQAYRDYFDNQQRFRSFARDITILVESERLITASGLEDLRSLQLEMALVPGVESATTLFSIPLPDPQTGAIGQFFPTEIQSDEEARELVRRLLETYPQAASLVSAERNIAVILVTLAGKPGDNLMKTIPEYAAVKNAAMLAGPADFELRFTGLTAIGSTIISGLVSDQLRLSVFGLLLGAAIAFIVFRDVVSAAIAALPTGLTALWTLGLFGWLGIPINYLTTVLPTLALIIAFEDSIMLTFQWQMANAKTPDADANMVRTLREVGPASALTSITTLLAFVAFAFVSGTALKQFAWLGGAAIALAYLSVLIAVPVAAHWAIRLGLVKPGKVREPSMGNFGKIVYRFIAASPVGIASAALAAVIALSIVHFHIQAEYRITDYLPKTSQVREAEMLSNQIFGGRSMLLVSVPKAVPGPSLAPQNRQRLSDTEAALSLVFPPRHISSANRLTNGLNSAAAIERLGNELEAARQNERANLQSRDGETMLVTVRIPSSQSIVDTLAQIRALQDQINRLAYGKQVIITGFDVLMAQEFTGLIEQLRASLIIEVIMGITIIGIATRSFLLAMAALTPNLLPILFVEFIIWIRGGAVNMSEVIALTIGFGIAIGNAVHIINFFAAERKNGGSVEASIIKAVAEAGPAVGASMIIICIATLVTQLSVLPMVPVLGMLIISTLIMALVANLAILPANIIVLKRFFGN